MVSKTSCLCGHPDWYHGNDLTCAGCEGTAQARHPITTNLSNDSWKLAYLAVSANLAYKALCSDPPEGGTLYDRIMEARVQLRDALEYLDLLTIHRQ